MLIENIYLIWFEDTDCHISITPFTASLEYWQMCVGYILPGALRNQEIFIFNTTKAYGQVNSTCLQNNILHIPGIKAIYHDNQVEKQNKTKLTKLDMYQLKEYATELRQFSDDQWK